MLLGIALLGVVALVLVFAGMWFWVNSTPVTGEQKTAAHLDVFKTTASVAVMFGGVGALYLAARRQRTQEREHDHAVQVAETNRLHGERVAAATENDAARRRVTELYTKAADQLGSNKAPVRLAGLYALERLAHDEPDQRRTVLNVLCAYLRMPYQVADPEEVQDLEPGERLPQDYEERMQEGEVRHTAQHILTLHLRHRAGKETADPTSTDYWPGDFPVNLMGATLIGLDFSGCRLGAVRFDGAHFYGETSFDKSYFAGAARFDAAVFHEGITRLTEATFAQVAVFKAARFDMAIFRGSTFCEPASFEAARFGKMAGFQGVTFERPTSFEGVHFDDGVKFDATKFSVDAIFEDALFGADSWFRSTVFGGVVKFQMATFENSAIFKATFERKPEFDGALANVEVAHFWPLGWTMNANSIRMITKIDGTEVAFAALVEGVQGGPVMAPQKPRAN